MAFKKKNYPEFRDIKIAHFDGYNQVKCFESMLQFLTDPVHAKYRLLHHCVNYVKPPVVRPDSDDPKKNVWVELTIMYAE